MAKLYGLRPGSKLPDEILKIATREKIYTAEIFAIGGVRALRLAYFNHEAKKYEEHDFNEFLEVTSIAGNISMKDSKPFVHIHGTFGRRDLSLVGGHVVSATVFPLLELAIAPTKNKAVRRFDEKAGLNVIYGPRS